MSFEILRTLRDKVNDEQKAYALESMRRMRVGLPTKRELAWGELKSGTSPEWVAHKYDFPVETMREARAKLDAEAKAKREAA